MAKQLINDPRDVVTDEIEGLLHCHPHLNRLDGFPGIKVIVDTDFDNTRHVAVVSGGGSGHEPMHAGFVGAGMLAASAAGEVFASPSVETVLAAIHAVTGTPGCLLLVNNYTGDRLNFGIAAERARAAGLAVEVVFIADDCAVAHPGVVGPRGLAGCMLVIKAAGEAAARGEPLSAVANVARNVAAAVSTIGVALTACTLPGRPVADRLAADEMEIGMGLHGEPGALTTKLRPAHEVVAEMLKLVNAPPAASHCKPIQPGAHVYLLVNALGALTVMETYCVVKEAVQQLQAMGVTVVRTLAGVLCSSLDMRGVSVSVLNVAMAGGDGVLTLLDAATNVPAWPAGSHATINKTPIPVPSIVIEPEVTYPPPTTPGSALASKAIAAAAARLVEAKDELNAADALVGDGDCGSTLALGAGAMQRDMGAGRYPLDDPVGLCAALGRSCRAMGGSSGALYEIFFTAAAGSLASSGVDVAGIAAAVAAGVAAMCHHGGATRGCRTMIDALLPAAEALQQAAQQGQELGAACAVAARAAAEGAAATKGMVAGAGRSSYVPVEKLRDVADPGAQGVAYWLAAVAEVVAS